MSVVLVLLQNVKVWLLQYVLIEKIKIGLYLLKLAIYLSSGKSYYLIHYRSCKNMSFNDVTLLKDIIYCNTCNTIIFIALL